VGALQAVLTEDSIGARLEVTVVRGGGTLPFTVTPVELGG
jgi:hypothetical protein